MAAFDREEEVEDASWANWGGRVRKLPATMVQKPFGVGWKDLDSQQRRDLTPSKVDEIHRGPLLDTGVCYGSLSLCQSLEKEAGSRFY